MRFASLLQMIGGIVFLVGLTMLIPIGVSAWYGEEDLIPFVVSALITVGLGATAHLVGRKKNPSPFYLLHKEGFAIVALGWLLATLLGALPYYLYGHLNSGDESRTAAAEIASYQRQSQIQSQSALGTASPNRCKQLRHIKSQAQAQAGEHEDLKLNTMEVYQQLGPGWEFCSFTNAFFESMSGFTTTGATVIAHGLWEQPGIRKPNELPRGLLLWRSFTQWLGGMGIIVLSVAIFPLLGVGGMEMYKAEAPGPITDKLLPRAKGSARLLWKTYLGFTVANFLLLLLGGAPVYDSALQALSTMSSGGFSNLAASTAGFNSPYLEWITILFMFIAGTNFTLHYYALFKGRFPYLKDPEFRFYTMVIVAGILATGLFLILGRVFPSPVQALRHAAFQVISIITTTGFVSADYEAWQLTAPAAIVLLFFFNFFGGCAGSTSGSIKMMRIMALIKQGSWSLFHLLHPRAVHPLRMGREVISQDILRSITGFVALYLFLFGGGAIVLSALGLDLVSSIWGAATCLGNVGPALGSLGPMDSFFHVPAVGLWGLSGLMLLGRLEIYTLLLLVFPAFWRK